MPAVEGRYAQTLRDIEELEEVVEKEQDKIQVARTKAAALRRQMRDAEATIADVENKIEKCGRVLAQLEGDTRASRIPLDTDLESLKELEDADRKRVIETDRTFEQDKDAFEKARDAASARRAEVQQLRSTLDGILKRIAEHERIIAETNARLAETGLAANADKSNVVDFLSRGTRVVEQLAQLRDFADNIEVAIDTATTAAALQQLRTAIRQKEREIHDANKRIELRQSWLQSFEELGKVVSSEQHRAIANFTRDYGPRASVIQQRLRSVYGFDEIETRGHGSTIRVSVKRGGENLPPTDYFSHSQRRTLLLGLFLTACISQNWSTLSTVLLDDPVIHFDDLNTYAFLDLVLGLLDSESGPRQFILSTCDEKVLHLARSKFRHLEGGAKFYVFSAIGASGPVVKELG